MTDQQTVPNSNAELRIQRIYVKDASFEAPNTPKIFQQQWEPNLNLDINTTHQRLEEGVYEVILSLTATVKNKDTVAFLAEVQQAGIFSIKGVQASQIDHLLGVFCPNILFPYASQIIASQVLNGSFPQLILAPVNFEALFKQQMEATNSKTMEKEQLN